MHLILKRMIFNRIHLIIDNNRRSDENLQWINYGQRSRRFHASSWLIFTWIKHSPVLKRFGGMS